MEKDNDKNTYIDEEEKVINEQPVIEDKKSEEDSASDSEKNSIVEKENYYKKDTDSETIDIKEIWSEINSLKEVLNELKNVKREKKILSFKEKMLENKERRFEEDKQLYEKEIENSFADRIKSYEEKIIELNSSLKAYEESNEDLKYENEDLKRKLESLNNYMGKLAVKLKFVKEYEQNKDKLEQLKELEDSNSKLEIKLEEKNLEIKDLKEKAEINEQILAELESLKSLNSILTYKNKTLTNRLRQIERVEAEKAQNETSSIAKLNEILEEEKKKKTVKFDKYLGDKTLISGFKTFAQKGNYYYDDKIIRGFVGAVKSSRLCILKGFSGTGKSSLPKLMSMYMGAECEIIPVQPNWKTKNDLMGFYNYFTHEFIPTKFTEVLLKASVNKNNIYFLVLDEMNLSRIEYYFSDFNSKLEAKDDEQIVELFDKKLQVNEELKEYIIDGNKIKIPKNIIFIGTINEDDSVAPISDKIYDRAQVIDFITEAGISSGGDLNKLDKSNKQFTITSFMDQDNAIANSIGNNERVNKIIKDLNEECRKEFNKNIGYRSIKQIITFAELYVNSGGEEYDAVDLQIVSKFIPKIKYAYSSSFLDKIAGFKTKLQDIFENKYNLSKEQIEKLECMQQLELLIKEHEV